VLVLLAIENIAMETRAKSEIWLIGHPEESLKGAKLPSTEDVLKLFFYHHLTLKMTIRDSARKTIEAVMPFWEKARIPCRHVKDSTDALVRLHEQWLRL